MTKSSFKRIIAFFGTFRTRVTVVLIVSLFFVMGLSNFLIYRFSLDAQFTQLREKLEAVAQTAALFVDAEALKQIPLNRSGVNSPAYRLVFQQLSRIKAANPAIKYIYTMAKTEQSGLWQFLVDITPTMEKRQGGPTAFPGDKYYAARFPAMLGGYTAPSSDSELMVDEWGVTLSGYAPIRDAAGNTVAVLGVDMLAQEVYLTQRQVRVRALLVLTLGIVVSVILGLFVSRRITGPIEKLVIGTRHIAQENLDYKVEIKGFDEISELAVSFNTMASSLSESKKRLQDYFYRVVQSLVRILEAKDQYTRGHSERVAGYAKSIALEMGFSAQKADLVEKVALLHDIGKLVIHENILNKKGKLTEDEWKIIKEHPVVGEEALKPVFVDEEVLAMVRSHHERYDGKGYPDRIKGDAINTFAQIISVADAFDAMTSARAYRAPLSQEQAFEEVKRCSGTQFNTQVVKAFLKTFEDLKKASGRE